MFSYAISLKQDGYNVTSGTGPSYAGTVLNELSVFTGSGSMSFPAGGPRFLLLHISSESLLLFGPDINGEDVGSLYGCAEGAHCFRVSFSIWLFNIRSSYVKISYIVEHFDNIVVGTHLL